MTIRNIINPPAAVAAAAVHRPPQTVAGILADCRQLSSGTIATLTGRREYAAIDVIRDAFIESVARAIDAGYRFDTWVDAWEAFAKGREF